MKIPSFVTATSIDRTLRAEARA